MASSDRKIELASPSVPADRPIRTAVKPASAVALSPPYSSHMAKATISGDIELLKHFYPIIIHRYSLNTDSAGAGCFRGGSGTCWEVEPIDHDMTVVTWGEGRKYPAVGAANARNVLIEDKVGRIELNLAGQETEVLRRNTIITLRPGDRLTNINPGGGGYGDPFARPAASVLGDVRNGIVSVHGAFEEYGVVVDVQTMTCDEVATRQCRASRKAT